MEKIAKEIILNTEYLEKVVSENPEKKQTITHRLS